MITLTPAQFMAVIATAWGTGILASGPDRFNGVSFQLIGDIAPWWFWGTFLVTYALVILLTERKTWNWAVVLFGGVPYAFIVLTYFQGASGTPGTSFVGASLYTAMWMIHVGIGTAGFMNVFVTTNWYKAHVGKV